MTGIDLWKMLRELDECEALPPDDRIILQPAFDALHRHEVIAIPELIIAHIKRLHSNLCVTTS